MNENEIDKNDVRKNNTRVFRIGSLIAILGSILATMSAFGFLFDSTLFGGKLRGYVDYSTGGALNDIAGFIVQLYIPICGSIVLGVVVIQLIIYGYFRYLSRRNIEIAGAKKFILYAFEFVVAIVVRLILMNLPSIIWELRF